MLTSTWPRSANNKKRTLMKLLAIRLRGKSAKSLASPHAGNSQINPVPEGEGSIALSPAARGERSEMALDKGREDQESLREPHVTGDAALFRASIGKITPLAEQNRISPPRPSTQARVRAPDSAQAIPDTLSDCLSKNSPEEYLGNGLSRIAFRKLRRGSHPVQDTLDLHGYQIDAARRLLQEFLFEAAQQQLRCVLVIHGKGANSPGGEAVLRELTRSWLTQHPQVLAFCTAPANLGGSGAVMILLKVVSGEW